MPAGKDRIRLLSPTDTWLLLQCAYTHDLGMCVSEPEKERVFEHSFENVENFKKLLNDPDFQSFLFEIEREYLKDTTNLNNALFSSVRFLLRAKDNNDDLTMRRLANQLKSLGYSRAKSMVALVTTSYFRKRHAERTRDLLLKNAQANTNNGIFPLRLRWIVAEIDYCHGGSWTDVMKLPRQETGVSSDLIHPQFIAALLRLGDLLDLDSNRFNEYQIDRLSSMPKISIAHELKHMAISDFLVTPKEIHITARYNYDDMRRILDEHYFKDRYELTVEEKDDETKELIDRSAKSLREWIKMIEEDLKQFSNEWNSIIPDNMTGSIASFKKSDIYVLNQQQPVEEDSISLRYSISPARSAQLIEGADLYRSIWAFIREIAQNAIDASKRQLGRDAIHFSPKEHSDFPLFPEYYCNLQQILQFEPVRVIVNFIPGTRKEHAKLEFVFIDQGIGITYEKLKQMRHIGAISKSDKEIKEIQALPTWLKPTGEFGIGMQSVFSLADSMTIDTYPGDEEGKPFDLKRHIKLYCPELGGDIVNREERRIKPNEGTAVNSKGEIDSIDLNYHGTDVRFCFELIGDVILKSFFDRGIYNNNMQNENEKKENNNDNTMPELIYAYHQKKDKAPLLDEDVVFSHIKRFIKESFTNDVIGLRFYFLKDVHPNKGWREVVHGYDQKYGKKYEQKTEQKYDKEDHIDSVIQIRFPDINNRITSIPNQTNFLSDPDQSKDDESATVYFWFNYEAEQPTDSISVLLTLKNNQTGSRVRLFYRGIAVCVKSSTNSLFKTYEIPGIDLKINIMSGNVSSFLEINREYVKATGYLELNRIIREALKNFYQSISKWEEENGEIYNRTFWENNPEHRLLYHLSCKVFGFDDKVFDDCDFPVKQYSIYSRIQEIKDDPVRIKNIINNPVWFLNKESTKHFNDTFVGNPYKGQAIIDTISDLFGFNYHRIAIIRSNEWYDKFCLHYTLTKDQDLPIKISDEDYGTLCVTILRQYLDLYLKTKEYIHETIGNYVVAIPAIERFSKIAVSQIPAESPGKFLSHFNSYIILPFKIKDIFNYYHELNPECSEENLGDYFPHPLENKTLFSDYFLDQLTRELDENEIEVEKKHAKIMQRFIDFKIMDRLSQGIDKKEVYIAYSQLLKMLRFKDYAGKSKSDSTNPEVTNPAPNDPEMAESEPIEPKSTDTAVINN